MSVNYETCPAKIKIEHLEKGLERLRTEEVEKIHKRIEVKHQEALTECERVLEESRKEDEELKEGQKKVESMLVKIAVLIVSTVILTGVLQKVLDYFA